MERAANAGITIPLDYFDDLVVESELWGPGSVLRFVSVSANGHACRRCAKILAFPSVMPFA